MIFQMKTRRRKDGSYTPILLHKNEILALRFASAYLFLYQSATTPSWVTCIEHEEDDVGLVDGFVQHADVVSPLRLVGSRRRRVGRGRQDVVSQCGPLQAGLVKSVSDRAPSSHLHLGEIVGVH